MFMPVSQILLLLAVVTVVILLCSIPLYVTRAENGEGKRRLTLQMSLPSFGLIVGLIGFVFMFMWFILTLVY